MLPEQPRETLRSVAPRLHQLWREATGIRTIYPEAKAVLLELFHRGYHLGIASNTLGKSELMAALRQLEITGLFEAVVLSSDVGERKPRPAALLESARRIGVDASRCAYVGNRPDRDMIASRAAGFGTTVILYSTPLDTPKPAPAEGANAEHAISRLEALLDIFRPTEGTRPRQIYSVSLSTMWARHNLPALPDFFESARRLGFSGVELNHQINTSMLDGIDLAQHPLSSIHEPCPADIPTEQLKERDWLISSPDEGCRRRGVDAIKRTIEMAARLRLPVMVLHCGMVSADLRQEQRLRDLLTKGARGSNEYQTISSEMIATRRGLTGPHMAAVRKSLWELLEFAAGTGVRLGLENRYHYYDIPSQDEMEQLLALAEPERLGFVYDAGHAQALDRLGFYPHEEWLRRFSMRIIEAHLHDVRGTSDHLAPGLGEVDFRMIGSVLPESAIRTIEVQSSNSPDEVRAGLKHLAECGCINQI
jgi:sugar phosphate isomerase/epimerase